MIWLVKFFLGSPGMFAMESYTCQYHCLGVKGAVAFFIGNFFLSSHGICNCTNRIYYGCKKFRWKFMKMDFNMHLLSNIRN